MRAGAAIHSAWCSTRTISTPPSMQAIAAWLNLSETTFVLPPTQAGRRLPAPDLHAAAGVAVRGTPERRHRACGPANEGSSSRALAGCCRNARPACCRSGSTRTATSVDCTCARRARRARGRSRRGAVEPARRCHGRAAPGVDRQRPTLVVHRTGGRSRRAHAQPGSAGHGGWPASRRARSASRSLPVAAINRTRSSCAPSCRRMAFRKTR